MPRRIKFMAYNGLDRRWEEVFPADEFDPDTAIPMFLSKDGKYYSIPGTNCRDVWGDWREGLRQDERDWRDG